MKKAILTSFMFLATLFSIAQVSVEDRIEFELKDGYREGKVIELGAAGFVVRSMKYNKLNRDALCSYELYDTDFNFLKSKEILVDKKFDLSRSYQTDKHLHTFFRSKNGSYILVTLRIPSLEVMTTNGTLPSNLVTSEMKIIGDYAFFKMLKQATQLPFVKLSEDKEYLFAASWKENKKASELKVINGINSDKISINNIQPDDVNNQLIVHAKETKSKTTQQSYLAYFDSKGKKTDEVKLDVDYNIVNISSSDLSDNRKIITGTYGKDSSPEGMFFIISDGKKITSSNTYKFTEIENFFSYLPKKKTEKSKKQKKVKESKKDYFMEMHDVIPLDDGYLVIGEAYYQGYRMSPRTSTVNGRQQTTYIKIPDGYRYTHAVIMKFDNNGNKQWDKTFNMVIARRVLFPMKFLNIKEKDESSIQLIFTSYMNIVSEKISYTGEILQDDRSEEMKTTYNVDKEKWTLADINYWYDNHFLAYGWQKLKNKTKRTVFFVSKIKYE